MKKFSAVFGALLMIIVMAASSFSAFAADTGYTTVNGVKVKKGSTVTYDLRLSGVEENVEGIQMNIYYDTALLRLDEDSVEFDIIKDAVYNTSIGAVVKFNATNLTGYDFSKEGSIIRLSFETLKSGETDISYYIEEMYDVKNDGVEDYIKSYTLTSTITSDGKVTKDLVPVVNGNVHTGTFVNNKNGKGEENGGNGGDSKTVATANNNGTVGSIGQPVTQANGETLDPDDETVLVTNGDGQPVTDEYGNNKYESAKAKNRRTNLVTVGIIVFVVIIVLLIVIKVIFDRRKKSHGEK